MDRARKNAIEKIRTLLDANTYLTFIAPDGYYCSAAWYNDERAYWLTWEYLDMPSEHGHGQAKILKIKLLVEIMLDVAPIDKWQAISRLT